MIILEVKERGVGPRQRVLDEEGRQLSMARTLVCKLDLVYYSGRRVLRWVSTRGISCPYLFPPESIGFAMPTTFNNAAPKISTSVHRPPCVLLLRV